MLKFKEKNKSIIIYYRHKNINYSNPDEYTDKSDHYTRNYENYTDNDINIHYNNKQYNRNIKPFIPIELEDILHNNSKTSKIAKPNKRLVEYNIYIFSISMLLFFVIALVIANSVISAAIQPITTTINNECNNELIQELTTSYKYNYETNLFDRICDYLNSLFS